MLTVGVRAWRHNTVLTLVTGTATLPGAGENVLIAG
jgi:hypothetical protein